jgi:integration host factor alpha subunit
MGRGSAQVLKSLEYPARSRIADRMEIRYESVIETAGAPSRAGEFKMADLGIARVIKDVDGGASLVERVLHHMCHDLSQGQNVKISGFGTFILRDKGQRVGRNPKTGIEVPIAPRRVMTFRASQIMRDRIAKG